jgi:cation transporter-like permease
MNSPQVSAHHHLRHWHHVYKKRRQRGRAINSKQMALGQFVSLIGAVIAGVTLDMNKETLAAFAGAFVVLPGVFDLSGSLGASLSAKINHRLESSTAQIWKIFSSSLIFTYGIALASGLIVSCIGALIASQFFDANFGKVFALTELSIALCCLIGLPVIGGLSVVLRKFKVNPDDVVGPIESSITDILSVVILSFVARLLS